MLTLQDLKDMKPGTTFSSGTFINSEQGQIFLTANPEHINKPFRWVAKRGDIHDWAIYTCPANKSFMYCISYGDKIIDKKNIKKLVPCTSEAFKMYRY